MRCFIAIDLPDRVKSELVGLQNELKASGAQVKWTEAPNIHLTLKFLGEINEGIAQEISRLLKNISENTTCFKMDIKSIGVFPKPNFPRIIWVGVNKGDKEIKDLVRSIEDGVEKIGIAKEEREFSSHITIGRVKSTLNKDKLVNALKALENKPINAEFLVDRITLFKSSLTSQGPVYEALTKVNLKTT
ncbi:MAG: RNA 2',3'-cyclic phosphodiesterase [Candidatus Omnitrophica bacterium]|nr:RNA 2',3'-cyclic phosphodiesterase [Candidatus Omnitrophota bacterium]